MGGYEVGLGCPEMDWKRKYLGIAAVAVVALGAEQVVQTLAGRDVPARPEKIEQTAAGPSEGTALPPADPLLPAAAALVPPAAPAAAPESLPAPSSAAASLPAPSPSAAPAPTLAALTPEATPVPAPGAPAAPDCAPVLTLTAAPQAMIGLTLAAPCHPGARVVLRHAGLTLAETLDPAGTLSLDLPALQEDGKVSALLPDATVAEAAVQMPAAARLRRFAVQWMADDAFQLTAIENGAAWGEPGFVTADNPVSPNGGYLVSLGDPGLDLPMLAQVYTWPADATVRAEPAIESAVTDLTCGRSLLGKTLMADKGQIETKDLSLTMPDCAAVGDILVLNNLVSATTLAAGN